MSNPLETLQILSHARHDWLNNIQLIDGYLSLNQPEKARNVINRVISQSRNESELMKLGTPEFTEKVLTFNWHKHPYKTFFEAAVEYDWSDYDRLLSDCFTAFTELLDRYAAYGEEQDLELMIQDSAVRQVTFHFQGKLQLNESFALEAGQFQKRFAGMIYEWNESATECSFLFKPGTEGTNTQGEG